MNFIIFDYCYLQNLLFHLFVFNNAIIHNEMIRLKFYTIAVFNY